MMKAVKNAAVTIFVALLFGVNGSIIIKTSACNGQNGTCSPNWCQPVTNAACVDPTPDTTDNQSPLTALSCKVCTQSTQSKCSSSYLNSVLKTGGGLLAVYCNDEFLVVYSNGQAVHNDGLKSIPRPPGESGVAYSSACVTRSYHTAAAFYKVPLNPVFLPTANASNNLYLFEGQTDPGNIVNMGLPESGPASVSVSGQSVFPLYNNVGSIAHADCEMDLCSAHAGQGFDYHYHGDPYHPIAGTCMYSPDDYESDTAHPPLIGWGLDGYEIYGRHISTSNLGYGYDLDTCGGHIHASSDGSTPMTYHYHAQVLNKTTVTGQAYTTYIAGVDNCWRGNISEVKFFGNSVSFQSRPDFDMLKPCCGSTEYYTAAGISLMSSPTSTPVSSNTVSPSKKPALKPTIAPSTSPINTVAPSKQPSLSPSLIPSVQPIVDSGAPSRHPSLSPSVLPSALSVEVPSVHPSRRPTTRPSMTPTQEPSVQTAPVVTLTTSTTLNGVETDTLTSSEENAVVNATATALGVTSDCVTDVSVTATQPSRRLKGMSMATYSMVISTVVVVPLISYSTTDETEAIELLTNAFNSAVEQGDFLRYLTTAAASSGSSSLTNGVSVESYSLEVESVAGPPTSSPTTKPDSSSKSVFSGTILYVVVGVGGFIVLLIVLYCVQLCLGARKSEGYQRPPQRENAGSVKGKRVEMNGVLNLGDVYEHNHDAKAGL